MARRKLSEGSNDASESNEQAGGDTGATDRMAAARAARGSSDGFELSQSQRFIVRLVQQASAAVKMLGQRARAGKPLSGTSVKACTDLSNELAQLLVEDQD